MARFRRSGWPCGTRASWAAFAATKSIAEAFGQAATHAPQPMHCAASKAASASSFEIGIALASGAEPVFTEMKPPAWMIRSNDLRSTTRSRITGNALARQGSIVIVSPSRKWRMCSWQAVVAFCGPWATPSITSEHMPQIPSRQSWSKATGSSPETMSDSFSWSSISRKESSVLTFSTV